MCDRNLTEEKKEVQLQPCVPPSSAGVWPRGMLKGIVQLPSKKIYVFKQKQQITHPFKPPPIQRCSTESAYKWSSWLLQPISGLSHHMLFHHQSHHRVVFPIEPLRPLIGCSGHRSIGITVSGRIEWHVTAEPTDCLQVVSPWLAAKD